MSIAQVIPEKLRISFPTCSGIKLQAFLPNNQQVQGANYAAINQVSRLAIAPYCANISNQAIWEPLACLTNLQRQKTLGLKKFMDDPAPELVEKTIINCF